MNIFRIILLNLVVISGFVFLCVFDSPYILLNFVFEILLEILIIYKTTALLTV